MSVKAYMYDVPKSKPEAPSYRTGANELQSLEAVTTCVPDTIMTEAPGSRPAAATVSFNLLEGALAAQQLGTSPIKVSLTPSRERERVQWETSLQALNMVVQ